MLRYARIHTPRTLDTPFARGGRPHGRWERSRSSSAPSARRASHPARPRALPLGECLFKREPSGSLGSQRLLAKLKPLQRCRVKPRFMNMMSLYQPVLPKGLLRRPPLLPRALLEFVGRMGVATS